MFVWVWFSLLGGLLRLSVICEFVGLYLFAVVLDVWFGVLLTVSWVFGFDALFRFVVLILCFVLIFFS